MKVKIVEICWPRQSIVLWGNKSNRKKYGTTRAKMSTVMNKGVKIHCKAVTTQVFTVVVLLVELGTYIAIENRSLGPYPYIS